jgi:hypothetical protein
MGLHRNSRNVAGYPICSGWGRISCYTQSAPRSTVGIREPVLQRELMMRRLLIVVVTVVMVGCGGGSTPTASPSPVPAPAPAPVPAAPPIPTASIASAGGGSWSKCNNSGCVFNGPMRNSGVGCANAVRGTVTFNNAQNQPLGTYQWSISAMVRPDETFVFTTAPGAIPASVSATQGNYSVSPSWTDVRCP